MGTIAITERLRIREPIVVAAGGEESYVFPADVLSTDISPDDHIWIKLSSGMGVTAIFPIRKWSIRRFRDRNLAGRTIYFHNPGAAAVTVYVMNEYSVDA